MQKKLVQGHIWALQDVPYSLFDFYELFVVLYLHNFSGSLWEGNNSIFNLYVRPYWEGKGGDFSMASLHLAWKRFLFCFCSYKTHPCSLRLPLLGQTWNITWSASFWVHECVCSPWFIVLLQLNPFLQPVYHLPLSLSTLYIHNIHQCINIYLAIYHPIYITINLSIYLSMRSLSSSLSFFLF